MRHRGFTLIHAVVVMTVMTVLLAICTSTLLALVQAGRSLERQRLQNTVVSRLSRHLRDDVRAARFAELDPSDGGDTAAKRLILGMNEPRRIEYRIENDRIVRAVREGDTTRHRESYHGTIWVSLGWRLEQVDGHRAVSLALARESDGQAIAAPAAGALRITAVLGADRRFLADRKEEGE
jgi:type II secretory pathway pseudopilin PulG